MMNKLFIVALLALSLISAPAFTMAFAGNGNGDDDNDDLSKLSDEEKAFQQGQAFGKKEALEAASKKPPTDKPDKDKPEKCKVKAQVKVINAVNNTVYTVQLDNLTPQGKLANNTDTVAFNFQYKKGGELCPSPSKDPANPTVEIGTVSTDSGSEQFALLISSATKPNRIAIDPLFDDQAAIEALQQEINQ